MKHFFLMILISLASLNLIAQNFPLDDETQKFTYMKVDTVNGSTKDQLFNKAKTWGTLRKYTVIREDKDKGEYVVQGTFPVKYGAPQPGLLHDGNISWTMSVYCKDGKYKYVLTNFVHTSIKGNGGKLENIEPECGKFALILQSWALIKKDSKVKLEAIVKDLRASMMKAESTVKSSGDDW
jgi:hypothetical protein